MTDGCDPSIDTPATSSCAPAANIDSACPPLPSARLATMLSSTLLASLLLALPLSVLGQQQNATSSGGGNGGNSTTTAAPQITQSYSVSLTAQTSRLLAL